MVLCKINLIHWRLLPVSEPVRGGQVETEVGKVTLKSNGDKMLREELL
jgi:hypothetical protein